MTTPSMRTAFFISDGTGITAETLGNSLLTQFPDMRFQLERIPFVNNAARLADCTHRIQTARERDGMRPLVFSTLVNPDTVSKLKRVDALYIDLFEQFMGRLEEELQVRSSHAVGRYHGIVENNRYQARIEAINYTMAHDDGLATDNGLEGADVILVGVSRSGKTPTSLYLAMQFGIKAANYPLIPEDFERGKLPGELHRHREKLFGLTISPQRLSRIRQERRPNSHYASVENCFSEISEAQKLMRRENIPWIDSTAKSIEEISATIMQSIRLDHA